MAADRVARKRHETTRRAGTDQVPARRPFRPVRAGSLVRTGAASAAGAHTAASTGSKASSAAPSSGPSAPSTAGDTRS